MNTYTKTVLLAVAAFAAFLLSNVSRAELEIVITKDNNAARPIAIVPFKFESNSPALAPPHDFSKIIADDLRRSGKFNPTVIADLPSTPSKLEEIKLDEWKKLSVDAVVYGRVTESSAGSFLVEYDMIAPFNDQAIFDSNIESGSYSLIPEASHLMLLKTKSVSKDNFRWAAHIAADEIYEALTGNKGAFATQVAYVAVDRGQPRPYQLFVADSDGYGQKRVFVSKRPIMSPTWSPDGNQLAYVTFESGRSQIVIQNINNASREVIAAYKGFNSAPTWSPDGTKMAMVLSKDGNPELYVMQLASKKLTRMTKHYSIDTEPSWHPDGKSLLFTSDRGGKPQIYQVSVETGEVERVTYEGRYNAGGEFTPDGNAIVMVHQTNSNYHIASLNLDDNELTVLTTTELDESLSIAPNGDMVIFSTVEGRKKVLSVVSMDGRFKAKLPANVGEVKAPAWSPFIL